MIRAECVKVLSCSVLCPVESDAYSDSQTQRGMDRYLDSLFDPVLSDSSIVSTGTTHPYDVFSLALDKHWYIKLV